MEGTRIRCLFHWSVNDWPKTNGNRMSGKIIFSFGGDEQLESHANVRRQVMRILTLVPKIRE